MLTNFLRMVSKRTDLMLAFLLTCIVFMMILPLPTELIDLLIGINLSLAAILLMASVYLQDVVQLSSFPSILLLTTLFPSGSRHLDDTPDPDPGGRRSYRRNLRPIRRRRQSGGRACRVSDPDHRQLLVITKGSERVAEVSARFSLDVDARQTNVH